MEKVTNALDLCGTTKKDQAVQEWDKALALAVGSIGEAMMIIDTAYEGYFGQTLLTLANEVCGLFGKCTASGEASIIDMWIDQNFRGLSFIEDDECLKLTQLVDTEVNPTLL
eukprot:12411004-Ditylum_brightwellii.AAC.1